MSRLSLALVAGTGALVTYIVLRRRKRSDPTASVPVVGWNGGGGLALAERSAKSTIFLTSPLTKFNLIYL